MLKKFFFSLALVAMVSLSASADLTVNGDFETGDTSDWESFPTANSVFEAQADANSGSFGGRLFNDDSASGAVIKQANIGIGVVNPGDEILISFAAKGTGEVGGVAFAEFFSELSGGGTSSNELLGGGPLGITSDWQDFNFTTTAGPDVSGGITLQFVAATGGAAGSQIELFIDDVAVSLAIPEPSSFAVLGLAAAGLVVRRRRK